MDHLLRITITSEDCTEEALKLLNNNEDGICFAKANQNNLVAMEHVLFLSVEVLMQGIVINAVYDSIKLAIKKVFDIIKNRNHVRFVIVAEGERVQIELEQMHQISTEKKEEIVNEIVEKLRESLDVNDEEKK